MSPEQWVNAAHGISILGAFSGLVVVGRFLRTALDRSRFDRLQTAYAIYIALTNAVLLSATIRVFWAGFDDRERYIESPVAWLHALLIFAEATIGGIAMGKIVEARKDLAGHRAEPPLDSLAAWLRRAIAFQFALLAVLAVSAAMFVRVGDS